MWWFDLVYPTVVAILLFTALTEIVYAGRPSSRLASRAEAKLLEFGLWANTLFGAKIIDPNILVVNGVPMEFGDFQSAPLGHRPELSAASYALILERLAEGGTRYALINWDLAAHPDDVSYYNPLLKVARQNQKRMQIFLAVSQNRRMNVPREVERNLVVLDDASCNDRDARETFCAHVSDDQQYIISRIIQLTDQETSSSLPASRWLTGLLPSNIPSFALKLPPPTSLRTVSFREVLSNIKGPLPAFAFVGADSTRATSGTPDSRLVRTVYNPLATNIDVDGTPLQVYWAQLASMFLRNGMLQFPPDWIRWPLTLGVCLGIGVMMLSFGGLVASTCLTIYACLIVPLANIVLIACGWYLPFFDSMYFGLAMLTFVGSGRLSYLSYLKWQHQEAEKLHAQTTDLKGNFVSLVSHNLNTPIAKMQGMLSILRSQLKDSDGLTRTVGAQHLVTCLELAVRFVLEAVALEDRKRQESSRSLDSVVSDFRASYGPVLKKLGLTVTIQAQAAPPDLLPMPLWLDVKRLLASLAALCVLFYRDGAGSTLHLVIDLSESEDRGLYDLRIVAQTSESTGDLPDATSFLHDVARKLIDQFCAIYQGSCVDLSHTTTKQGITMFVRISDRAEMA